MRISSSEESSEDIPDITLDWSEFDPPRNLPDFEGVPGLQVFPENPSSVGDVTSLFIEDDLFDKIAKETNTYRERNHHNYPRSAHSLKWKDVTIRELKKWFGLVLIMAIVRKNTIGEYWFHESSDRDPIL